MKNVKKKPKKSAPADIPDLLRQIVEKKQAMVELSKDRQQVSHKYQAK